MRDPSVATSPRETLGRLLGSAADPDRQILIEGATVLTMDPGIGDYESADILIRGKRIEAIEPGLGAREVDAIRVDASGTIAVPGFQDTHRHCWQNQLRRLIPNADLARYVEIIHVLFGPIYRPEDMHVGNLISGLGGIDSGVTTILDFSHNARSIEHSEASVDGWEEAGIRAVHASCAPLQGAWEEQWPGDLSRLREARFSSDDQLVTLAMGVLGKAVPEIVEPAALSADNLRQARELEIPISVDGMFGALASSQLEELAAEGLLGEDVTYIHCQDLSERAWELIRDTGAGVALAPTSDAQVGLASASTPVQKALDMGIRPALSVDVECCLTTDMHSQMQMTLSVQRMQSYNRKFKEEADGPEPMPVRDVLEFATAQGARANWLDRKVGTLTPGKEADLLLIRVDDINSMPLNNAYGSVVLGSDPRNIETVLVAGHPRKWTRELVGVDRAALEKRVVASRDYLVEASGYQLDVLS